jgi:uncharacterized protein
MTLDILLTLQEEFRRALISTSGSTPRNYTFPEAEKIIKVAMGIRRSGKTYFLFQTIRKLVAEGVLLDQILHLNFEDDRLMPINHKSMGKMIDAWYTLYPQNHDRCCYLFLDEVQNVDGWPLVLRRILDTKNVQIYVTGSSAKLLSKEIATSLRGRSLAIEVAPYDYSEYLAAHGLEKPLKSMGQQGLDKHRTHLLHFFRIGGFPGVQSLPSNEHLETLQTYVETVIFRDIIERYRVNNVELLKYFIHSLIKNISAPFSINKFHKEIKSQGYKVGKDTLHAFLSYLEDAFLIFSVPIFTESLRKVQTTPKKVYGIDNGLITANSFNLSDNSGKLLENQVYLDLRRQGKKIFYYHTKDGYEVDFVTQDKKGQYELIQVVWEMDDPKTAQREKRALSLAQEELGFPGRIIDWKSYLREF